MYEKDVLICGILYQCVRVCVCVYVYDICLVISVNANVYRINSTQLCQTHSSL